MSDIAICAKCGRSKELCNSVRSGGIKQPRLCKDCLIQEMSTGDYSVNNEWWIMQMVELGDADSLAAMMKKEPTT